MVGELADAVMFGRTRADAIRTRRRLRISLVTSGLRVELPTDGAACGGARGEKGRGRGVSFGAYGLAEFVEETAKEAAAEIEAAFDRYPK